MSTPPLTELPVDRILKTLRTYRQGPLLTVELNVPDEGNAVTDAMLDDLLSVLDERDPTVRVLVLAAAGEEFCLGGDRREFPRHLADDPAGGGIRANGTKALRVCEALTSHPAVTIARVQGRAVGAGVGLALACDLRVGADTATFRLPELALGVPPAWGGLLPRLISEVGVARVRELILTARVFDAQEALGLSVLQRVVPREALDDAVMAWAKPVLRRPASALRVTKAMFNSLTATSRLADTSVFDPELLAAVLVEAQRMGTGR